MLFDPLVAPSLQLPNRIVMAPMTRSRAVEGNAANALMAEYYGQRAAAGLIITEGTSPRRTVWATRASQACSTRARCAAGVW